MRTLAGERRGSLLAAIDRTVTAAGSRLLAQRLAAPLTDPDAIARRLDAVEAFVDDATGAPADPRAAADRARSRARAVAAGGRPRRPARSRRDPRRLSAAAALAARLDALAETPAEVARCHRRRCGGPIRRWRASWRRRSPTSCRCSSATAASCARATTSALDEARALRDESRKVIAQLQARYADDTGVRALKIRHNNVLGYFVEVTAQHGDKLHGRAAQRDLHPPPDAGRPGALHHHRARRARSQDRQRRRPRARARARDLRAARGGGRRRPATPSRPPPRRWRCSTSPRRWPACGRARLRAARDRPLARLRDRGRPPSGGRAGARPSRSSPTTAICRRRTRRATGAAAASGCSPAPTWPASRPSCARTR